MSVRFVLAIAKIHDLDIKVIAFVLAFPQANFDVDVYMEITAGMVLENGHCILYVLKLNKALYGLKQAPANWYEMLSKGLIDRGVKYSEVDPCMFISNKTFVLVYVDDCTVISRKHGFVDNFIHSLNHGSDNFKFTKEDSLENYVGVKFVDYDKGDKFEMKQPFLTERIIESPGFEQRMTNSQSTPAA